MTAKRFKLFVGKNYGVQTSDGEVIFDSIISIADADVLVDLLNDLYEENTYLKLELDTHKHPLWSTRESERIVNELKEENEQLKQRNNRQAKQLDRLYNLIEQKDWRTISDILDDFKQCEEQLQQEWKCYE